MPSGVYIHKREVLLNNLGARAFPGWKHTEEVTNKISKSLIGNKRCVGRVPWDKGIKRPDSHPIGMKGKVHTEEWKMEARLRRHTDATKRQMSLDRGGDGSSASRKEYKHYKTAAYREWRENVFERDCYSCLNCGVTGGKLHPHHIKSYTYSPEDRYDVDNGVTLCVPCHHQLHFGH